MSHPYLTKTYRNVSLRLFVFAPLFLETCKLKTISYRQRFSNLTILFYMILS